MRVTQGHTRGPEGVQSLWPVGTSGKYTVVERAFYWGGTE